MDFLIECIFFIVKNFFSKSEFTNKTHKIYLRALEIWNTRIPYLYFIPVGITISILVHLVTILFSFFSSWLSLRKSLIFIISFFLTRFPLETWNIFNAVITKICLTWFPLETQENYFLYFLVNKKLTASESLWKHWISISYFWLFVLLFCLYKINAHGF